MTTGDRWGCVSGLRARGRRLTAAGPGLPAFEACEPRTHLAAAVALMDNNFLVGFDTASPGATTRGVLVTGMSPGEDLAAIDFNPRDGALYGVGVARAGGEPDSLYRINPESGAATRLGAAALFSDAAGSTRAVDFHPVTGLLTIVSGNGEVWTVSTSGAAEQGGGLIIDDDELIHAIAYSDNHPGATESVLFGLSYAYDRLSIIDADGGNVFPVGDIGVTAGLLAGFDIAPDGTAFAALRTAQAGGDDQADFGTINLATGAFSSTGVIGGLTGAVIRGLAVEPVRHTPAMPAGRRIGFGAVLEDAAAGRTVLVRDLIAAGGAGLISDADPAALRGLAVVGVNPALGAWRYSLDGSTWHDLPPVGAGYGLLLPSDSSAALRFIPAADNTTGASALTVSAWDQTWGAPGEFRRVRNDARMSAAVSTQTAIVDVTITPVRDAPTLEGGFARQRLMEDRLIRPFRAITIAAPDGQNITARVRIDTAGFGGFTPGSLETTDFTPTSTPGEFALTGSAAEVQTMLGLLRFAPTRNLAANGATVSGTATLIIGDALAPAARSFTTTLTVEGVNEAPVVAALPAAKSVVPLTATNVFGSVRITDGDPSQVLTVTVKLSTTAKGGLTAASVRGAGFISLGRGEFRFTGTAEQATAAVRKLRFNGKAGLPPSKPHRVSIAVMVNDGTSPIASQSVMVTVLPPPSTGA